MGDGVDGLDEFVEADKGEAACDVDAVNASSGRDGNECNGSCLGFAEFLDARADGIFCDVRLVEWMNASESFGDLGIGSDEDQGIWSIVGDGYECVDDFDGGGMKA